MPNKRKICTENMNPNQLIYIPSLQAYYQTESVLNSAYRKVLDFKENAEKILEKERTETLSCQDFSKAILDSRSFEISLQHNCIKLKCYITLEKDNRESISVSGGSNTNSPTSKKSNDDSVFDVNNNFVGGAKKVNVEVLMKSNPFRIEENEKTTRMELVQNVNASGAVLKFTYYVKPECEARRMRDANNSDLYENGRLVVFTNDFFTVYQNLASGEMNISLNEIVQTLEEQRRTEALGEKLFILLKDRPRHRALLTNECKLNNNSNNNNNNNDDTKTSNSEEETYYTRELIQIYGQPIVPSFHKQFNYQLSNTHYGYRTLRRLLNCDILRNYVRITKEVIKSLDRRVVEFVQLTEDKCMQAFQINLTCFYDAARFQNGIIKNWLDVWYVERLKERHNFPFQAKSVMTSQTGGPSGDSNNAWSLETCRLANQLENTVFFRSNTCSATDESNAPASSYDECDKKVKSECDEANHLWFCLRDYDCIRMDEFLDRLRDYINISSNRSDLIPVQTAFPVFEYKEVIGETRRILAMFLSKFSLNKSIEELINLNKFPTVSLQHIYSLLSKFLIIDGQKKVVGFTALFEILAIVKREMLQSKTDEVKYSHFLGTLERSYQDKLKMAIIQLKCVPCLNKFAVNTFGLLQSNQQQQNQITNGNMNRLLKQMSLIVSTELQQMAIDIVERYDEDISAGGLQSSGNNSTPSGSSLTDNKPVKYLRLKEEFRGPIVLFNPSDVLMRADRTGNNKTQSAAGSPYLKIEFDRNMLQLDDSNREFGGFGTSKIGVGFKH